MQGKFVLGFLILLQKYGIVRLNNQLYSSSDPKNFNDYDYHRKTDFGHSLGNSDSRKSFGFYNIQTGDEFYMSDFVMRPKFKTKYDNNSHKIDFEYSPFGFTSNAPVKNNCTNPDHGIMEQTNISHKNKNKQVNQPNNRNKKQPSQNVTVKPQNRRRCVRKKPNGVKVIVSCSNQSNKKVQSFKNNKRKCNETKCRSTKTRIVANKTKQVRVKQGNRKKMGNRMKATSIPKTVQNYAKFKAEPETNKSHIEFVSDVIKKYLTRLKQKFYGIREGKKVSERDTIFTARSDMENRTIKLSNNLLSLFTVIQVHNFKCVAKSESGNYNGKCYYPTQCKKLGGISLGECTNGFGVCCVFINTCGGISGQNCSYFQSPGYPRYFPVTNTEDSVDATTINPAFETTEHESDVTDDPIEESSDNLLPTDASIPDPRNKYKEYQLSRDGDLADALTCVYQVYKISNDIQQMRIDLIDLDLAGPTDGECVEEKLVITGQFLTIAIPVLCGYNSGQHVYVDVSSLNGPLKISLLANAVNSKRYKIRICQFSSPCSNSLNCLQYYTGAQGIISSFNYDRAITSRRSNPEYLVRAYHLK